MLDPDDLDGDLAQLYALYRAELDRLGRLGPRPAAPPRRRAARDRPRRLARRARLRVRLRGPDRRRVGAARSARRAHRRRGLAAVRAGPRRVRVARAHRRRPRRARVRARRGAAAALERVRSIRRSRTSSARSSRSRRRRRRALDAAVRFLEGAGARGTLELVGDELARADPLRRPRPSRSRSSRRRVDAWRGPLETVLGALDVPYAVESRVRLGATPIGHALLQLLRYAWARRRAARAVRVPAQPVLRARALVGRLRRRASARPRDPHAGARRGGGGEAARGAGPGARRAARRRGSRRARCASCCARCCARRTARTRRRPARRRASTCARTATRSQLLDRARAGSTATRDERGRALERCEVRLVVGRRGGRVAVLDLMRARTRRFEVVFVLGLEEGSLPRRSRTSPFLDDDRRARARRPARAARPGVAATATSSTPRARARRAGSTSCARRRPTTARRASRARSGRRSPPSSTTTTSRTRRRAGRSPRSRGRSTTRRPSASGCARSRCSPRPTPTQAVALAEANGWERRLARARGALRRETRLRSDALLARLRREDDVRRHGARAVRRLLVGVALRARHLAAHDRRRGRRDAARLGRAQRAAQVLRRAAEGARLRPRRRPRTSSRRSGSCAAVSTTRCAAASGSS